MTSCRSTVSGSISLPSPGFFSPFPHGTCALSVAAEYSALDRGRPGFGQGSSCPALLRYRIMESLGIRVRGSHPLWPAFPCRSASLRLSLSTGHPHAALQPRPRRFGLLRFRSPLLAESRLISVPGLLRWFTSPSVALPGYFIHRRNAGIAPCGLPHSDIRGSVGMCPSPRPFAACRVLHRLTAPQASAVDLYLPGHILPPAIKAGLKGYGYHFILHHGTHSHARHAPLLPFSSLSKNRPGIEPGLTS